MTSKGRPKSFDCGYSTADLDCSSRFASDSDDHEDKMLRIAHREDKAVNRSRAAVILVLLVCGSVLGGISFLVGRRAEDEACLTQVS